jgi:dTDP-4-dehydrorhamnose reductase
VYGKTKSLGEVRSPNVNHLRCSIIGPEQKGHLSLLDWLLNQPQGAKVCGYTNHLWNGVTTLAFAKLCHGIMSKQLELSHVQHVVPLNVATKAELLSHFNYFYHRNDIQIEYVVAPVAIDRTLSTLDAKKNQELWQAAGYDEPPYIQQMIEELANYQ